MPEAGRRGRRSFGVADVTPIFLFSLPRSGSTFVQRVLAAHDGVGTAAEPWILLPLLSPVDDDFPTTDGWHGTVAGAIEDFTAGLPHGRQDWMDAMREAALRLYAQSAGPDARFFVDKTPPYSVIPETIIRAFPDARFVFLWRDPLSVVSSIVETLAAGRWRTYRHRGTLFDGIGRLVSARQAHADRVHAVRYEDLVAGEEPWRELCDYIGIDFDAEALSSFASVRLDGRMGDPTGVHRYTARSAEPLEKWRSTITNPLRREWCRRWLRWLGRERLAVMGYDLDRLLADLDALDVGTRNLGGDLAELVVTAAKELATEHANGSSRRPTASLRALLAS